MSDESGQPKISPEASARLLSIMLAVSEAIPVANKVRLEWDTELGSWQLFAFTNQKPHGIWTWSISIGPQTLFAEDNVAEGFQRWAAMAFRRAFDRMISRPTIGEDFAEDSPINWLELLERVRPAQS